MAPMTREWTLCPDQGEWLDAMSEKHGLNRRDAALQQLIDYCNAETNERKRMIFRVIRCHRCSQASMGGKKAPFNLEVREEQFTWLNTVQEKCNHKSVDKTLRIMLDFYKSTCGVTPELEAAIFTPRPPPEIVT